MSIVICEWPKYLTVKVNFSNMEFGTTTLAILIRQEDYVAKSYLDCA